MAPGSAAGPLAVDLWVQEVINAVEISHHERRWVTLPLDGATHADRAGHDGGTESDPDAGGVA
jgi:hypothetical protein